MKTSQLRLVRPGAKGVGISVEFINDIIERVEDLVKTAEEQKPIAGEGIQVEYTNEGSVIRLSE